MVQYHTTTACPFCFVRGHCSFPIRHVMKTSDCEALLELSIFPGFYVRPAITTKLYKVIRIAVRPAYL